MSPETRNRGSIEAYGRPQTRIPGQDTGPAEGRRIELGRSNAHFSSGVSELARIGPRALRNRGRDFVGRVFATYRQGARRV